MHYFSIKEGATGILRVCRRDNKLDAEYYYPKCDLEAAKNLLHQFYELKTVCGAPIKEVYKGDIDFFPTVIGELYWLIFYQYVKYTEFIHYWMPQSKLRVENEGNFKKLMQHLYGRSKFEIYKKFIAGITKKLINLVIRIRNELMVNDSVDTILLLRQSMSDFRTNEILKSLQSDGPVVQWVSLKPTEWLNNLFDPNIAFRPYAPDFLSTTKSIKIQELPNAKDCKIHAAAAHFVEGKISTLKYLIKECDYFLRKKKFKLLVGLDDTNYVYPYIYSARNNQILSIGIQHGLYAKLHESYVMEGIQTHSWYDHLIVWGNYWRELFLKYNRTFSEDRVHVGSNKHQYNYKILARNNVLKSILVPYEFLADTRMVGKYLQEFHRNGCIIYFKPRPDESVDDQLESYCLPSEMLDEIQIMVEITVSNMAKIDLIVGTQTTLLYDLAPFGKPIWILDTDLRLLDDMVENGLAEIVRLNDMQNLASLYMYESKSIPNQKVLNKLNGNQPIGMVINNIFLTEHALAKP